jgi:ankyrin repeat protein
MLAASYHNAASLSALLEGGASIDKRDDEGWSALTHAAMAANAETVATLLQAGAKIEESRPDVIYEPAWAELKAFIEGVASQATAKRPRRA